MPTYHDLYSQDDAGDIGFSASPRSEADIDRENAKGKPLAYRTKIKKGGKKAKKYNPTVWGTEGRINPEGMRRVDGGDRLVPPAG